MTEHHKKKPWVELIVDTTEDVADAVSDFLISALSRGVYIEDLEEMIEEDGPRTRIHAYLSREDLESGMLKTIEGYFLDLKGLYSDLPVISWSTRAIVEEDWSENWKKYFKPLRIGRSIVIKPSWEQFVPGEDDIVIDIDPGRAFGVGTHASTSLMLEVMEDLWNERPWAGRGDHGKAADTGPECLDVGTGTGILGITAAKLGSKSVLCLDIDPDAVETARENCLRNHVHHVVLVSNTPVWQIEGPYDIVLANIDRETLVLLAGDLARLVKTRGRLVLSGFLSDKADSVAHVYGRHHMKVLRKKIDGKEGQWACMVMAPTDGNP